MRNCRVGYHRILRGIMGIFNSQLQSTCEGFPRTLALCTYVLPEQGRRLVCIHTWCGNDSCGDILSNMTSCVAPCFNIPPHTWTFGECLCFNFRGGVFRKHFRRWHSSCTVNSSVKITSWKSSFLCPCVAPVQSLHFVCVLNCLAVFHCSVHPTKIISQHCSIGFKSQWNLGNMIQPWPRALMNVSTNVFSSRKSVCESISARKSSSFIRRISTPLSLRTW